MVVLGDIVEISFATVARPRVRVPVIVGAEAGQLVVPLRRGIVILHPLVPV